MFEKVDVNQVLNDLSDLPLIDVRSPSEFIQGHIPKAINIPLFSNDERAIVGTTYKKQSKEQAIEVGYGFVEPKLDDFLKKSAEICTTKKGIIIQCWRGGMRSQAFARHLSENGFTDVYVIEGGYKQFRRKVLDEFESEYELIILGGYTGSGKTEILSEISKLNHQVIDLEGIAHHKGSTFGGIGNQEQTSTEQFENDLFWKWKDLDKNKTIWIEDESRRIGNVLLPQGLYDQLRIQKVIFIDIPREKRAQHLTTEYSKIDTGLLKDAVNRISKRLGSENTLLALQQLDNNDLMSVALTTLRYYDKRYEKGLMQRASNSVQRINLESIDYKTNADTLLKMIKND